jgi:hypothetical protein
MPRKPTPRETLQNPEPSRPCKADQCGVLQSLSRPCWSALLDPGWQGPRGRSQRPHRRRDPIERGFTPSCLALADPYSAALRPVGDKPKFYTRRRSAYRLSEATPSRGDTLPARMVNDECRGRRAGGAKVPMRVFCATGVGSILRRIQAWTCRHTGVAPLPCRWAFEAASRARNTALRMVCDAESFPGPTDRPEAVLENGAEH